MKQIIISHERGGSVTLDRNGCFRFVKGYTSKEIGTEITIVSQPAVSRAMIVAIAACLALMIGIGGFGVFYNADSYSAYVDVNPSVELVFNNLNRLKKAMPVNADGAALLEGLTLTGKPGDVIISIIKEASRKGYDINSDDPNYPAISITVVARGGKSPDEYAETINAALAAEDMKINALIMVCDEDFRDRAASMGVSPGKLKLAERLFSSDQTNSIEDILNMPVKNIMETIKAAENKGIPKSGYKDAIGDTEGNGGNNGNNNNSGNGNETPPVGPGNNNGNGNESPPVGPGNNNGNGNETPPAGPGNNSGNGNETPPAGPGNNNGNGNETPPVGPGNNNGNNGDDKNPNAGPGNNSGNGNETPPAGSGNNNGNGNNGNGNGNNGNNGDSKDNNSGNNGNGNGNGNSGNNGNNGNSKDNNSGNSGNGNGNNGNNGDSKDNNSGNGKKS